jgi:hypothetical protein
MGLLAETRQGVKLAQQGNNRLALADAGDKSIGDPASITGQLETFRFQGVRQPPGGPELLKARLRVVPDIIGDGAIGLAACLNYLFNKLKNRVHHTPAARES